MANPARTFAFIVAINQFKYANTDLVNLRGPVNDGKAMMDFLERKLMVPVGNIFSLWDSQATRAAILRYFQQSLVENPRIQRNDLIIIFFATHGTRIPAPNGWTTNDGYIEAICPYDMTPASAPFIQPVHAIPDYTLNSLLRQLANKKGSNIVVILDCCFSASQTRDSEEERYCHNPLPIPPDLDKEIWDAEEEEDGSRGVPKRPPDFVTDLDSHVLLASSTETQSSDSLTSQGRTRGVFTFYLLMELKRVLREGHQCTYVELIDSVGSGIRTFFHQRGKPLSQTPQCIGVHRHRYLFSMQSSAQTSSQFPVSVRDDGKLHVSAGRLHGIMESTDLLLLFPTHQPVTWRVEAVSSDSAVLSWPPNMPIPVAAQIISHLVVYAEQPIDRYLHSNNPFYHLVNSESSAQLTLKLGHHSQVEFKRSDPLISSLAHKAILSPVQLNRLPAVLEAISRFYHYFYSAAGTSTGVWGNLNIQMYLFRLQPNPTGFHTVDVGGVDLFRNYQARVPNDQSKKYGLEIVNRSNRDLFVYVFLFEPSDYSIQAWYKPLSNQPFLKAMSNGRPGRISVGYGSGGGEPLEFCAPRGDFDTSFLKVFVSERHVNLDHLEQGSAFNNISRVNRGFIASDQWGVIMASVRAG